MIYDPFSTRPDPNFGVIRQIESVGRQSSNSGQLMLRGKMTRWFSGHDDHVHVRYCEPYHPLVTYRCG